MKITEYAIKKRVATFVIACGLLILGLYGFLQLPVNYLPDITYPLIRVNIWWRGATPEEIDKNLADIIEESVATVDGLDFLESSSIEGMYSLELNFKYGVTIDTAYQDTLAAVARVSRRLPKDIDPPVITKADPSQFPVAQITITSDVWDLVKLRDWTENWLQKRMLALPGVAGSEVIGGLKREIRVHLDPNFFEKYDLSLNSLVNTLRAENLTQFGGRVVQGSKEYIARTTGEFTSLEDIRAVVVYKNSLGAILLGDIAEVEDAHEEVRVITRLNAGPAVKLSIMKQADANTVEVANAIDAALMDLRGALPEGVTLGVVENQAVLVEGALNGVKNAAIEAAFLVLVIVYLFLGSWRHAAIMLVALPTTLIVNFGLMNLAGFSLNIFSLGGLVVAIGVVLDNSIVVLENITRTKHISPSSSLEEVVLTGTRDVGSAIVAATLSFLALFLPFLLVPGLTTLLFKELILVIAGIFVLSLAVAVTLTPMLANLLLGHHKGNSSESWFERQFAAFTRYYERVLAWVLRYRIFTLTCFSLILLGGVVLAPRLGSEFLATMDDGRVMVKVKLSTGDSLVATENTLKKIEDILVNDPLVESFFTLVGGRAVGQNTIEVANEGQIDIQLIPRHTRTISSSEYVKKLRPMVAKVPIIGGRAMVMVAKAKGIRKLGDAEIEVKIKGQELDLLFNLAQQTLASMTSNGKLINTYISLDMTKPEFQVQIDRIKAAELGISVTEVADSVRNLITGVIATEYRSEGQYYNVRLMIPEKLITTSKDIENLSIRTSKGSTLRIRDVASVIRTAGPVEIIRNNQIKAVVVRADTAGISVGEATQQIKDALESLQLPPGYSIEFGGQTQMMQEMTQSLLMVLFFAIVFSFMVLAVQFNNLKIPALILACVPFGAVGMVYILYLSGLAVGATVMIGALIVIASIVNEGVLLLTFAEELRKQGQPPLEAVAKASSARLRPRLMVAMAIMVGFIPLALNIEDGGDLLQPMAVGAIGGIGLSIFVALFFLPCLYVFLSKSVKHASMKG